jgi:hypothetical protein
VTFAIATVCAKLCAAADSKLGADNIPKSSRLIALAAAKFPNLTHAERAMLWFSDVDNIDRGKFAIAGSSSNRDDPTNDPAQAEKWDRNRDIRAALINWLCVDPAAIALLNRRGIAVMGARVVGGLDLSYLRVPFSLLIRKCVLGDRIRLVAAELPHLDLNGSYVSEIDGKGLIVHGDLNLADGFHAAGETRLENAKIDGELNCSGGYFHSSTVALSQFDGPYKPAIIADLAVVGGDANLGFGFHSDGAVLMRFASIAGTLDMFGSRLSNPGNVALRCNGSSFGGVLFGTPSDEQKWGGFDAIGKVEFLAARVRAFFNVNRARFLGTVGDGHGFSAAGISIDGALLLRNVELQNGAFLDLSGARVTFLVDDENSWPAPGNLNIDGFTYSGIVPLAPTDASGDARTRLRWLQRQSGFHLQPYRQLAKVLRERGDEAGATQVLVAGDDLNYERFGLAGRIWGGFLKYTIGYGHRPLLALLWSLGVVLVGWLVVLIGKRAGVMRLTWPETTPVPTGDPVAGLNPLLYSLDVFVPFVNLHQEHYWWPDESALGQFRFAGREFSVRGSALRVYLWLQIIAGWLLSAIFIAGVTGLIRND